MSKMRSNKEEEPRNIMRKRNILVRYLYRRRKEEVTPGGAGKTKKEKVNEEGEENRGTLMRRRNMRKRSRRRRKNEVTPGEAGETLEREDERG